MISSTATFYLSYLVVLGLMIISLIKIGGGRIRGREFVIHSFELLDTMPLRGIMACLIIVTHVSFKFDENHFAWPFTSFGASIVSIFFFLSGYGLTISYIRKRDIYLIGFVKRTFIKLFLPLLCASTIWIIISCIWLKGDIAKKLLGFILFNPPLPYSWFVYALLILYMSFYVVYQTYTTKKWRLFILLLITFTIVVVFRILDFEVYWYISLFAFNVGVIYGEEHKCANYLLQKFPIHITSFLIVAFIVMMMFGLRSALLAILPMGIVVSILALGSGKQFKWLNYLGKISYEIYLAHGIVVPLLGYISLGWGEYILLAECLTILLAYLLNKLNGKFLVKMNLKQS